MRDFPTKKWLSSVYNKSLKFFVQTMSELTFDYTNSFYKPNISTIYTLSLECEAALIEAHKREEKIKSARHMLNELIEKIKSSSIFGKIIKIDKSKCLKMLGSDDIAQAANLVKILKVEFSPIKSVEICIEELKTLIMNEKTCEKKAIYHYSNYLVSELLCYGMGKSYIYKQIHAHFLNKKVELPNSLDAFFEDIFPYRHEFTVCFRINTPIVEHIDESRKKLKVLLCDEFPKDKFLKFRTHGFEVKNDLLPKYILVEGVEAYDIYSAIKAARRSVNLLHDVFKLFHHKSDFELSDKVLLKQCCKDDSQVVTFENKLSKNIHDTKPEMAIEKSNLLFTHSKLALGSNRLKFFSAVEFHGISSRSEIVESKITSLWTSFEAVVPSRSDISNIDNVLECVLPIIVLNYGKQVIVQLYRDLNFWGKDKFKKFIKKCIPDENISNLEKLVIILNHQETDGHLENLLARINDHELLKFRVCEVANLLEKPKKLFCKLEEIKVTVNNELRRLYRARNRIIHSGLKVNNIERIYEIGHFYFDEMFSFCIEMSADGYSNFSDIFNFARINFEHYCSELKSSDSFNDFGYEKVIWSNFMGLDIFV